MQSLVGLFLFLPAQGLSSRSTGTELHGSHLPEWETGTGGCQQGTARAKAELLGAGIPVRESQGCDPCGSIFLPREVVF